MLEETLVDKKGKEGKRERKGRESKQSGMGVR